MIGRSEAVQQYEETLPEGIKYTAGYIVGQEDSYMNNTGKYVVPDGHCFMMGDNRDASADSRIRNQISFIPYKQLIGRAEFRYWSSDFSLSQLFFAWDRGRIFRSLRAS